MPTTHAVSRRVHELTAIMTLRLSAKGAVREARVHGAGKGGVPSSRVPTSRVPGLLSLVSIDCVVRVLRERVPSPAGYNPTRIPSPTGPPGRNCHSEAAGVGERARFGRGRPSFEKSVRQVKQACERSQASVNAVLRRAGRRVGSLCSARSRSGWHTPTPLSRGRERKDWHVGRVRDAVLG